MERIFTQQKHMGNISKCDDVYCENIEGTELWWFIDQKGYVIWHKVKKTSILIWFLNDFVITIWNNFALLYEWYLSFYLLLQAEVPVGNQL